MRCWVILVNYNGSKVNSKCIDSILASETELEVEIVVVDNDSSDNSVDEIKSNYEMVKIIEVGYNSGFAHANNVGMLSAADEKVDYIFLLNNDTEIENDAIQKLYECEIHNPSDIIVPRIMYFDEKDRIWYAGGYFDKKVFNTKHRHINSLYPKAGCRECITDFATGCSMFFSVNLFKKVGIIPEEYFLYYEDCAYSEIAKISGAHIHFIPDAVVYHKVSSSTGGKTSKVGVYYATRNRMYFVRKYHQDVYNKFLAYFMISRFLYCIRWIIKGQKELAIACVKGIQDYQSGNMGRKEDL